MNPLEKLDAVTTTDGRELVLYRRAGTFTIRIDGCELMSSRAHGSEEEMARLAWRRLRRPPVRPRVLIGGLGMGYTLRATLDQLPERARVTVAEVFGEVVRWNREWLGYLAGHPLLDPRVRVEQRDVYALLQDDSHDLILLDVDNGPDALTLIANQRLYDDDGLARLRRSLRGGGAVAIWAASPDRRFLRRMRRAGLESSCEPARARAAKGPNHAIFIGRRS